MSGGTAAELIPNKKLHDPKNEEAAIKELTNYVSDQGASCSEADIKKKEEAIMTLGETLASRRSIDHLRTMIERVRPFLISLGNAKAAKLVRNLVDLFLAILPADHAAAATSSCNDIKVDLCLECVKWATEQNRVFLRQTLQARLVRLYNDIDRCQDALKLATELIRELKKLDDKDVIVEVQLEESKACYMLNNLSKARAALVSARTTANSIYIQPRQQAALDMQSGVLHAADERDFKTAYSYFYEAFEGFDSVNESPSALRALKYMCLCKIMLDASDEVASITTGKLALKYSGSDLQAMQAIANAANKRSLADFNLAFGRHRAELQCDAVVKAHFHTLSDGMLEKDLTRIIEPYSRVQIDSVAKQIDMDRAKVEKKLAQMILDKKISGTLDQGAGILLVYKDVAKDETYAAAINTIHALGDVVNALQTQISKLK